MLGALYKMCCIDALCALIAVHALVELFTPFAVFVDFDLCVLFRLGAPVVGCALAEACDLTDARTPVF